MSYDILLWPLHVESTATRVVCIKFLFLIFRLFYKQRIFLMVVDKLVAGYRSASSQAIQFNFIRALSSQLKHVPSEILFMKIDSVSYLYCRGYCYKTLWKAFFQVNDMILLQYIQFTGSSFVGGKPEMQFFLQRPAFLVECSHGDDAVRGHKA